ncbi:MAG: Uncharacterised protein [Flavobacteriia bacterium]|nr:MAG: Uncharacterised protein [Flavobacteriia bacterium]
MPGSTASDDQYAVCLQEFILVLGNSAQPNDALFRQQAPPHGVANRLGLLVDLFEHKVIVAALLNGLKVHLQLSYIWLYNFIARDASYCKGFSEANERHLIFLQIDSLLGVFQKRRSV